MLPFTEPLSDETNELATYRHRELQHGQTRDVTQTCAYQSNEPTVIAVDPQGKIQAGQLRRGTVMARFMGKSHLEYLGTKTGGR